MKLLSKKSNILLLLFAKNNIICTLTNLKGNTLTWLTTGSVKLKGTKKVTNVTIFLVIKKLYLYNKRFGYTNTHLNLKGINKNKNLFVKYLKVVGFNISSVTESTCLPHNGCKKKQKRKV